VASPSESSPWQRFEALRAQQPELVEEAWHGDFAASSTVHSAASEQVFFMQKLPPAHTESAPNATKLIVSKPVVIGNTAARIGQCMHRLLELYRPAVDLSALAPSVAASFQLDDAQSSQALQAAQSILSGEASWVWDAAQIDWQANEVELMQAGQLLRIDRLVKHRESQTWWVLDYKTSPAPQRIPELQAQLQQYQAAVQQAYPEQPVKAAFITAQGKLIEL
jgi:ATP-dependent helicase/nuclease subunit A